MYLPSLALQEAIVKQVSRCYKIFDFMPDEMNVPFPYILLGAELLGDTICVEPSSTHYITLHVWTNKENQIELKEIIHHLVYMLTVEPLPLPEGYQVGRRRLRLSSTHREIDANREQLHGVVQFDFNIRQTRR